MIKELGAGRNKNSNKSDNNSGDAFSEASFGAKLSILRKEKKLTQKHIAQGVSLDMAALGKPPITDRAVSKWETGDSMPDAQQFISLCGLLGVTDVLKTFRGIENAADPFLGLNKLGRERAAEYVGMLASNPYFSYAAPTRSSFRQIPLYDLPASAGTGVFLDGDSYTMIDADENVPDAATFAVRLSGDSMTPRFNDGQIVYVRQQQELSNGDIGIFLLNGEAYCKKLDTENGVHLVSLNTKYKPIPIGEGSDLRIVGRVVG